MPKFVRHIFICCNQRSADDPRGCCDPEGKAGLQRLFKIKLAQRGIKDTVRANKSGCLNQCEHGPNIVVYPDAVWYGHVSAADLDEIIDAHIIGHKPVERLITPDACLNVESCPHKPRRGQ